MEGFARKTHGAVELLAEEEKGLCGGLDHVGGRGEESAGGRRGPLPSAGGGGAPRGVASQGTERGTDPTGSPSTFCLALAVQGHLLAFL